MFRRDDCTVRCATRCVCLRRSCISEHVFSWGARFVQKMRFDGIFKGLFLLFRILWSYAAQKRRRRRTLVQYGLCGIHVASGGKKESFSPHTPPLVKRTAFLGTISLRNGALTSSAIRLKPSVMNCLVSFPRVSCLNHEREEPCPPLFRLFYTVAKQIYTTRDSLAIT